jgi:hypothetical protein
VIEPEVDAYLGDVRDVPMVDAHTMSPDVVLATLARLGGSVGRIVIKHSL